MTQEDILTIWEAINKNALKWPPSTMEELLLEIGWIHGEIEAQALEIDRLDCAWHELHEEKEQEEQRANWLEDERDDVTRINERLREQIQDLDREIVQLNEELVDAAKEAQERACDGQTRWPVYRRGRTGSEGYGACVPYA